MKCFLFAFLALEAIRLVSSEGVTANRLRGAPARDLVASFSPCVAAGQSCNGNQDCVVLDEATGAGECICKPGYSGPSCNNDEDECMTQDACSFPGGYCQNRVKTDRDGYGCGCDTRFGQWKNGTTFDIHGVTSCMNLDECATGTHNCPSIATCIDQEGGFVCACPIGFEGEDCADDVDECQTESHYCDDVMGSVCENSEGSFSCVCEDGLENINGICEIPQLQVEITCDSLGEGHCEKTVGLHRVCTGIVNAAPVCDCAPGWTSPNGILGGCSVSLAECGVDGPGCTDPNHQCIDIPSGYFCFCKEGFTDVNNVCVDQNECSGDTNPCNEPPLTECVNLDNGGGFMCMEPATEPPEDIVTNPPPPPQISAGPPPIPRCGSNSCGSNASCANTATGIICTCNKGYIRNAANVCEAAPEVVEGGAWLLVHEVGFRNEVNETWIGSPADPELWASSEANFTGDFTKQNPNLPLLDNSTFYIRRLCADCGDAVTHKDIIYKRYTDLPDDFDVSALFLDEWLEMYANGGSPVGNVLGTDFELFSTMADAVAGENQWVFCDYFDSGTTRGFPRRCGPTGRAGSQNWNRRSSSGSQTKHFAYYVWAGNCDVNDASSTSTFVPVTIDIPDDIAAQGATFTFRFLRDVNSTRVTVTDGTVVANQPKGIDIAFRVTVNGITGPWSTLPFPQDLVLDTAPAFGTLMFDDLPLGTMTDETPPAIKIRRIPGDFNSTELVHLPTGKTIEYRPEVNGKNGDWIDYIVLEGSQNMLNITSILFCELTVVCERGGADQSNVECDTAVVDFRSDSNKGPSSAMENDTVTMIAGGDIRFRVVGGSLYDETVPQHADCPADVRFTD